MSDQILPMMERIPSEYEEQRQFAIRKIEEITQRATQEMKPWVDFLARIEATRPTVYYVDAEHWKHIQSPNQQSSRSET